MTVDKELVAQLAKGLLMLESGLERLQKEVFDKMMEVARLRWRVQMIKEQKVDEEGGPK